MGLPTVTYHQRGAKRMTQGALPFKYEEEKNGLGLTALGGLPVYLDMAQVMGLAKSIDEHVGIRREGRGYTDSQIVMSLILLNLAGGQSVDDLKILEQDEGFRRVFLHAQHHDKSRAERRRIEKRWRKASQNAFPSASSVFRYLKEFAVAHEARAGRAVIPEANAYLLGLIRVNRALLSFVQRCLPRDVATLDMDATLVETRKATALYSYKKFLAYQPLNVWWAEQGVIAHSEFRDGNVPAGFEQLRVLRDALKNLPAGVKTVRMRSDTAGYQHDLLGYCDDGTDPRFGRIEFAVGCPVSSEFKKAVLEVPEDAWQTMFRERDGELVPEKREWAEVCFVPNEIGKKKSGREYRYLATREAKEEQIALPGMEEEREYPFPTMTNNGRTYKVCGIVTNMDWNGQDLIHWLYERCGESEEVHRAMKDDFAGGRFPSGEFGENAAWWWIMLLALNLNAVMKRLVLGGKWATRKMKAIRFALIHIPARVITHARGLVIRCGRSVEWLIDIRCKIGMLCA